MAMYKKSKKVTNPLSKSDYSKLSPKGKKMMRMVKTMMSKKR